MSCMFPRNESLFKLLNFQMCSTIIKSNVMDPFDDDDDDDNDDEKLRKTLGKICVFVCVCMGVWVDER